MGRPTEIAGCGRGREAIPETGAVKDAQKELPTNSILGLWACGPEVYRKKGEHSGKQKDEFKKRPICR